MLKNIIGICRQVCAGVGVGLIAAIFLAQYDPWVHHHATQIFLNALEQGLHCKASGKVCLINVLKPELVLNDVCVCAYDASERYAWGWHAKRYVTSFSWWQMLTSGVIDMSVMMDGFDVQTQLREDGSAAIMPHLTNLIAGPDLDIPLYLKSLTLRKASLIVHALHNELVVQCAWNSESKKINDRFRSTLYLTDGSVIKNQRSELSQLSGSITADVVGIGPLARANISMDCRGQWAAVPDQLCFVTGTWEHDHGSLSAYNMDRSLIISPCALTYRDNDLCIDAAAQIPFDALGRAIGYSYNSSQMNGMCKIEVAGSLSKQILHGNVNGIASLRALPEQTISLASTFTKDAHQIKGHAIISAAHRELLQGEWNWDVLQAMGSLACTNAHDIPIVIPTIRTPASSWVLHPSGIHFDMHITRDAVIGSYHGAAHHDILAKAVDFSGSGTCALASGEVLIEGFWKDHRYILSANSFAAPFIKNISYTMHDQPMLTISHVSGEQFDGEIQIPLLRSIVASVCNYDVQGEGALRMVFSVHDSQIVCDAHLHEGTIRLPETYNFINGLKTHIEFNPHTRTCLMRDLSCVLHSGTIRTKRAVVHYAPDWSIDFVHMPIWLDRCLLNSKKDLFATTSANLLLSKPRDAGYTLMGHVILDRSQLKENIFSDAFQKTLVQATQSFSRAPHFDMACNVSLETKDPVRVDTDFLKANAQVHLAIRNTIMDPSIIGAVNILSGTLKFPYKPLQINRGSIQFVSDQPLNPLIELIAKNTIKNHRIALQVTGSLRDHMVMMESTPPLTQEQIVGLLLAGAHDESLSAVIPALLMQNITNLVFSSNEKAGLVGVWDRYVKPWIKQFNVNFVPRLSDQTGRGGLRGILEMSVNDRWRALIEKNFSLTEDTRFELEYLLSDDVTFRLIRDERYDIGGEVEMRWKF